MRIPGVRIGLALAAVGVMAGSLLAPASLRASEAVPSEWAAPVVPGEPDPGLFAEALRFFSNAARRAQGLGPLADDPALTSAAMEHARNMARLQTHGHVLPVPGQRTLRERLQRRGVTFRLAGETIARDKIFRLLGRPISMESRGCAFLYGDTREPVPVHTYASLAQQTVARWLASPRHRAALLSPRFRRIGSGLGVDPSGPACGDFYLVQTFAD